MKTIQMLDMTLTMAETLHGGSLTFKETMELARSLDRIGVDMMEMPFMNGGKADALVRKTIGSMVRSGVSVRVSLDDSAEEAWHTIKDARRPHLNVVVPVSPVQMEYTAHRKAPALLEAVGKQVAACRDVCEEVEITCEDATRAEKAFLTSVIQKAVESGAGFVTLCDTAGIMLPDEFASFVQDMRGSIPDAGKVQWYAYASDDMHMASANAAAAVKSGVDGVRCTAIPAGTATLSDMARFLQMRGTDMGCTSHLRTTELNRTVGQIERLIQSQKAENDGQMPSFASDTGNITLDANDSISEVVKVVRQLGYELSDEDNSKVYEAFQRVAAKKNFVGTRELDAIVASTAMQVPSTYRIESYVINSGNVITATANLTLEKDGKKLRGVSVGDGPIDAAFLAIEQIIGHHYELDDFQIQAVTEGREAMGSALVRLRAGGRLYSGNGISTDIIGASIRAYISALNKIVYEEA